jgi:hypothetical protein
LNNQNAPLVAYPIQDLANRHTGSEENMFVTR